MRRNSLGKITSFLIPAVLALLVFTAAPALSEGEETVKYGSVTAKVTDTKVDLKGEVKGGLEELTAFLDQLPALAQADMYESTLTLDQMETLSSRYPNVFFGWTLTMGDHTLRTDATAFSTLHNHKSRAHKSKDFEPLKYCKNLLALDLGHNAITDISFLNDLPNLRILILGRNKIADTTPIGTLKDLEYLELFSAGVKDVSALSNCVKLKDLNISNNKIKDLSPVLKLPALERLWLCGSQNGRLSGSSFTKKQKQEIQAQVAPGCEVNFSGAGTEGGWRNHPRYNVLFEIFNKGAYRPWE